MHANRHQTLEKLYREPSGVDPSVCVFGPSLFMTVTIEDYSSDIDGTSTGSESEIHIHPGGQAFWIARMLRHLGENPRLVSPLGGEIGTALEALAPLWGVEIEKVQVGANPPGYVHDRRSGQREELARSRPSLLDRHELDDLYGRVVECAVSTGMAVITGKHADHGFPLDAYRRLGADFEATDVTVVGDFHGDELETFLEGGPIHMLKVSDDNLVDDGLLPASATESQRLDALHRLADRGVANPVISATEAPTFALLDGREWSAEPPMLEAVDHRGSGDSMTAALAAAVIKGLGPEDTLRLGCGAGAANVTRHGLGNVKPGLVERLADEVEVDEL